MSADHDSHHTRHKLAIAVAIVVALACSCFALSFSALWDVSTRVGWPRNLSWLGPVIVDGTILQCTVALVATTDTHTDRERRFFWGLLGLAAAASIGGNALHAVLPPGRLEPVLAAVIATIPAAFLLLTVHSVTILIRPQNDAHLADDKATEDVIVISEADDTDREPDQQAPFKSYADAVKPFIPVAHRIRDQYKVTTDASKVAVVLHAHAVTPTASDRTIAKKANVSHGTVGRIRAASDEIHAPVDDVSMNAALEAAGIG